MFCTDVEGLLAVGLLLPYVQVMGVCKTGIDDML